MTRSWGLALAVGVLISSAVIIPWASDTAQRTQQFVLDFEIATSKPTVVEIFVDRGGGIEPLTAMSFAIEASGVPRGYQVPLATGRYRAIRIDPFGDDGEFELQRAKVRDRYGRDVHDLDWSRVTASSNVTLRDSRSDRLAAVAQPGRGDPWVLYTFATPLVLWLSALDLAWFATLLVACALLTAIAAHRLQKFDRPLRLNQRALPLSRRPRLAVVLTAALAAFASMYPLFFGRSLVTPNNGPRPLVYSSPPYVASSSDIRIEDARAADVQATMWVTLPYVIPQRMAIANGEFPWWNRFSENGAPLLGQAQTSIFDPLQWILLVGDLATSADAKYVAARLIFLTGVGVACFAAAGSLAAALVLTVGSAFIGHFIARLNDPIHFSIIYAPWVLVAFSALLRAATPRSACRPTAGLLLATALLVFSSSVKETFALLPALYLAGGIAIVLHHHRAARLIAWKVGLAIVAAVGGGLLTAPHWLTFFETLSSAFTAYDQGAAVFAGVSQGLSLAIGALMPGIVHPGLNPLIAVLALMAVVSVRSLRASPLAAGCTVVSVIWLIIAFGIVPEPVLMRLPLFSRVHHIGSTFVTGALPLMLVVAAAGVVAAKELAAGKPAMHAIAATLVATLCVASLAAVTDYRDVTVGFGFVAAIWSGVLVYTILRLALAATRMTVVVCTVAVAGLLLPSGLHLDTGFSLVDQALMQPRVRAPLTSVPPVLRPILDHKSPARVAGLNGPLQAGVPAYLGFEGVTGADALHSPYTRWLGERFEYLFPLIFRAPNPDAYGQGPLFDLWGVRWLVVPRTGPGERLSVIERPSAWPRAFFASGVELHPDRERFLARLLADARPFASVSARDSQAVTLTRELRRPGAVVEAGDYDLTANTTTFTITATGDGVVVLNEGFWPGVTATINDTPVEVFRVNESMRGVRVTSGTWRIRFAYRPTTWKWAAGSALAGGLVLLVLVAIPSRGARGGVAADAG